MGVPLVRGLGPRLPRPRADAGRSGLRQAAARADAAASATCTRTARSRPTSGTSATSTRRCTPGPRSSPTGWRRRSTGEGDVEWLKRSFQKLLLNFTWWVNRKDRTGQQRLRGRLPRPRQHRRLRPQRAAADRRLPGAGRRHRLDGALLPEHARDRRRAGADAMPAYADMALKFVEHFLWIASAMVHAGGDTGMWDEEDGFFYDVLRLPDGQAQRLKVRSMVGLLPLCAVTVFDGRASGEVSRRLGERLRRFLEARPESAAFIHDPDAKRAVAGRRLGVDPGRDQAPPRAGQDARRERVPQPVRHPLAVALPRRASVRLRRRRPGIPRRLPAGGIRHRHVRRQLELARPDLDAGQRA